MTKYIVIALLAAGLVARAGAETPKDSKVENEESAAKPAKSSKSAKPAAAREGSSSKTRQTPFGTVAETSTPAEVLPSTELSSDSSVSAEEQGELVIFRRKTPFGDQVWKKKKADLTADERSILARGGAASKKAPAQPEAANPKTSQPKASDKL